MGARIPKSTILTMCVKAMNDMLSSEGHILYALVFEIYPSTPVSEEPPPSKPTLQQEALLSNIIRIKIKKQMIAYLVQRASRHDVPLLQGAFTKLTIKFLFPRETSKQLNRKAVASFYCNRL